jgi:peptidoglycan/xylan/chitin deacetylase (PgdA/CDA1 family)
MHTRSLFHHIIAYSFILFALLCAPITVAQNSNNLDNNNSIINGAIILQYHRFGEDKYPSTNTRIEQLESHIKYLKDNNFTVLPLIDIITAIQNKTALPANTVGISIDDAYISVYEHAWPLLKKANFPFTIFVVSDVHLHNGSEHKNNYMTWEQIGELANAGVDIGSQTLSHAHLPLLGMDETRQQLINSADIIENKIGKRPLLLSYPYGEASDTVMQQAKDAGYIAAFGQHSGPISNYSNFYYLPRFPVNEKFGEMTYMETRLNSVPLPVKDFLPTNPVLSDDNIVNVGFSLDFIKGNMKNLTCYHSAIGRIEDSRFLNNTRLQLQYNDSAKKGRTRINCTAKADSEKWYWFGMQFVRY